MKLYSNLFSWVIVLSISGLCSFGVPSCSSPAGTHEDQGADTDDLAEDLPDDPPQDPLEDTVDTPAEQGPQDSTVDDGTDGGVAEEDGSDLDQGADEPIVVPEPVFPGLQVVNPLIGTGSYGAGVGSTLPGATLPFGMVKVSPDTQGRYGGRLEALHCAGYRYDDAYIEGFSHTHLSGTGMGDYASILFMPTIGMDASKIFLSGYRALFGHETEVASPGYYAVDLGDPAIRVELTASERGARHRYTFPADEEPWVIVDLGHTLDGGRCSASEITLVAAEQRIEGWMTLHGSFSGRYGGITTYFSARFDTPWEIAGTWRDGEIFEDTTESAGTRVGAFLGFAAPGEGSPLVVQAAVGISFVSVEQARLNLETELDGFDFEATLADARSAWESALSVIEVAGGSDDELTLFYTGLYHALMMPTLFTDVNGLYRGFDREIHEADGFLYYTDFSLWDTYRNEHSLLALLYPDRQRDMMISLLSMYEQGGYFPRWPQGIGYSNCMVGSSAEIVVADSYVKGILEQELAEMAYQGLKVTADALPAAGSQYSGREGISDYIELGYVPADRISGSVSRTMEYAYDDFAMAQLARALGHEEDAERYGFRTRSYRNLWDPDTAFFRGRLADGAFVDGFWPTTWLSYYVEGNAWHYRFFVPHDPQGLIDLFGSPAVFVAALEEFFGQCSGWSMLPDLYYWHGNEPDIHSAYLFVEAGRPDLTQYWARWIMEELYGTGPDGLAGNDDAGTLSAWYVFSALGFYPVAATDRYLMGSPSFPAVRLVLPGGRFEIRAPGASSDWRYIQAAELDGEPLDRPWLVHSNLVEGGLLELTMGPEVSDWGRP